MGIPRHGWQLSREGARERESLSVETGEIKVLIITIIIIEI